MTKVGWSILEPVTDQAWRPRHSRGEVIARWRRMQGDPSKPCLDHESPGWASRGTAGEPREKRVASGSLPALSCRVMPCKAPSQSRKIWISQCRCASTRTGAAAPRIHEALVESHTAPNDRSGYEQLSYAGRDKLPWGLTIGLEFPEHEACVQSLKGVSCVPAESPRLGIDEATWKAAGSDRPAP